MAAPSPITSPLRSRENGRQVSGASTRSASQPFMVPKAMEASAPPVTATGALPERTIWNASPMAWVADAQALATTKAGPRNPQVHGNLARRRIDHQLRDRQRMQPRAFSR